VINLQNKDTTKPKSLEDLEKPYWLWDDYNDFPPEGHEAPEMYSYANRDDFQRCESYEEDWEAQKKWNKERGIYKAITTRNRKKLKSDEQEILKKIDRAIWTWLPTYPINVHLNFGVNYNENGHIIKLSLFHRNLKTIPAEIFDLPCLESLFFHGCDIESIPETIGKATLLKYLELDRNPIRYLPDSIGNLAHLKTLIIYNSDWNDCPILLEI
jgi:Leucine-rich repeat (LRR) protein